MNNWISFKERLPDKFPCMGRNYDLCIEDTINGIDMNNKAFEYACYCSSLPFDGMSMPFTHWMPLPEPPK